MVMEAIAKRRSIREYKPVPVSAELIHQLLEAACMAPSAGNLQSWFFYVIENSGLKRELSQVTVSGKIIENAPVTILVCALPEQAASRYGERGAWLYCLQDTAAAVQNMLLAATALGLATCWIGAFSEEEVAAALDLPVEQRPVAMVTVGYGAEDAQAPVKKPAAAVSRWLK